MSHRSQARLRLRNTAQRWGWIAIFLHWLVAILVIGLFVLGLWMVELTYYSEWYQRAPWLHRSIGILLLAVMIMQLLWRLSNAHPTAAAGVSDVEQRLARATHRLLILLIFLVIVSGYLISTAKGRSIDVLGWFELPALPWAMERQADLAGLIHKWLAIALVALASGHALAAIKHHLVNRDDTLLRMLGREQSRAGNPTIDKQEHTT